jgi:hypothetical protein
MEYVLDKAPRLVVEEEMVRRWAVWPARSNEAANVLICIPRSGRRGAADSVGGRRQPVGRSAWHCGCRDIDSKTAGTGGKRMITRMKTGAQCLHTFRVVHCETVP